AALLRSLAELTQIHDASALHALEQEVGWVVVPAKTFLFRCGDIGDALYLVLDGRLHIFAPRGDGSVVRLNQVGPGETLGEMALVTNAPRSADVVARTDASLLRLSKRGYETLVHEHPETTAMFSRLLAARLAGQI